MKNYSNIPAEMRALRQWVGFQINKDGRKIPLNPKTKDVASVSDSKSWGTFEEVTGCDFDHIGFCFTSDDPFCFIDLDTPADEAQQQRQQLILEKLDSYTEVSVSGTGWHIFVRGKLPKGVRRDNVEIYPHGRFCLVTGDTRGEPKPIREAQDILDILFTEMNGKVTSGTVASIESNLSDQQIVDRATNALNGQKFLQLCRGEWQSDYPSQSEADHALLSILCFYTKDHEQIKRLFRYSALGKRAKAQRDDYLQYSIQQILASQPPAVDIKLPVLQTEVDTGQKPSDLTFPPGFVGEAAEYFFRSAIRPVPETALATAIALMAGIIGRSFNFSGTGLNLYIILLARTGTGKEETAKAIERMATLVRPEIPTVDIFIGPSSFASGQAMIRVLDERPCFVSVLGEFGLTLQNLCSPRADNVQHTMKKVLLDLYSKSGHNQVLRSSVYADVEKNTKMIRAPSVTLLGESTPENFFDGLDESHIAEGLIPRFMVLEYHGGRPKRNKNAGQPPDKKLLEQFKSLVKVGLATLNNNSCSPVACSPEAELILDQFDEEADDRINAAAEEQHSVLAQLWNRAHLKALKLAALIAVGCNIQQPVITPEVAQWSVDFVRREISGLAERWVTGHLNHNSKKQQAEVIRVISDYLKCKRPPAGYAIPTKMLADGVVTYEYLMRRCMVLGIFVKDRKGARAAIKDTVDILVESGLLVEVPAAQLSNLYGTTKRSFNPTQSLMGMLGKR